CPGPLWGQRWSKDSPGQSRNLVSARPPTTDQRLALRQTFGSCQITVASNCNRRRLLDQLVGAGEQRGRDHEPSALAGSRFRKSSTFVACTTGSSLGLSPLRTRATCTPAKR